MSTQKKTCELLESVTAIEVGLKENKRIIDINSLNISFTNNKALNTYFKDQNRKLQTKYKKKPSFGKIKTV